MRFRPMIGVLLLAVCLLFSTAPTAAGGQGQQDLRVEVKVVKSVTPPAAVLGEEFRVSVKVLVSARAEVALEKFEGELPGSLRIYFTSPQGNFTVEVVDLGLRSGGEGVRSEFLSASPAPGGQVGLLVEYSLTPTGLKGEKEGLSVAEPTVLVEGAEYSSVVELNVDEVTLRSPLIATSAGVPGVGVPTASVVVCNAGWDEVRGVVLEGPGGSLKFAVGDLAPGECWHEVVEVNASGEATLSYRVGGFEGALTLTVQPGILAPSEPWYQRALIVVLAATTAGSAAAALYMWRSGRGGAPPDVVRNVLRGIRSAKIGPKERSAAERAFSLAAQVGDLGRAVASALEAASRARAGFDVRRSRDSLSRALKALQTLREEFGDLAPLARFASSVERALANAPPSPGSEFAADLISQAAVETLENPPAAPDFGRLEEKLSRVKSTITSYEGRYDTKFPRVLVKLSEELVEEAKRLGSQGDAAGSRAAARAAESVLEKCEEILRRPDFLRVFRLIREQGWSL